MYTIVQTALSRRKSVAAIAGAMLLPRFALAETEQQELIRRASMTIQEARNDPQFGSARHLFQQARAIMVVPELYKGGFFVGGEGGSAVLLDRAANGAWGNPRFYTLASLSFGLQIGIEVAEVVMFVMSERALRAWMTDEVKLGAKAGLTVLVIGTNAEAAATTNANVDVIAWARSKGAYAGITLEGSVIKPRHEWNTAYYGRPIPPGMARR